MSAPPESDVVDTTAGEDGPLSPIRAPSPALPRLPHSEIQREDPSPVTTRPKRKSAHGDNEANDDRARGKLRKKEKRRKRERKAQKKAEREARRKARREMKEVERRPQHRRQDEDDLERPLPSDYVRRYGALNPAHYPMGPVRNVRNARSESSGVRIRPRATMPSVPDPLDDRPLSQIGAEGAFENEPEVESPPRPRVPVPARSRARSTRPPPPPRPMLQRPSDLLWCHEFPVKKMQPFFTHMPAEVRILIYRGLLVTQKNIVVYGKWTRIFPRHKPGLRINILLTCREIYKEAIPVLYGENTFLYRLRDPPALFAQLFDVNQLAYNDEAGELFESRDVFDEFDEFEELYEVATDSEEDAGPEVEDEDEPEAHGDDDHDIDDEGGYDEEDGGDEYSDGGNDDDGSEYEEEQAQPSRNRRSRSRAPVPDILIDKFKPLIRNIAVQAESNRCTPSFKSIMAQAIRVFASPVDQSNPRNQARGIKNITIRVAPTQTTGQAGGWTFLDFFDRASPVMRAATAVQPDSMHIEFTETGKSGARLSGDMRSHSKTQRIAAGREDRWKADVAQQAGRRLRARRCEMGVVELREKVLACCRGRWQTTNDAAAGALARGEQRHNEFWSLCEWDESGDSEMSSGLPL